MPMTTPARWTIRAGSPTSAELNNLQSTIKAVAPKAEKPAWDAAMRELEDAIEDFRSHYPYKSGDRRKRGKISEQRDALAELSATLRATSLAVKKLPMNAKMAFLRGPRPRDRRPLGEITSFLDKWSKIAAKEYRVAKKEDDRRADDAPNLLAFCVVRALSQTLQGKVSMTSDRNTAGHDRNGAAYCRLLRSTLQAAGADPPADLVPIMKEGKRRFQKHLSDDCE